MVWMQPLALEQLGLGREQGSIIQPSLLLLCWLCCWLPWEMGETTPCSKSPLLLLCFQRMISECPRSVVLCVSLWQTCNIRFRACTRLARKAPNLHRSDPKENTSQNSWRRAACRSSFLGQSDELIAAALPSASEVRRKGWLVPRGSSCKEWPQSWGSG